jgi:hypothetical protein
LTLAAPFVLLVVVSVAEELLRDADGGRNGYAGGYTGNDLLAGRHTFIFVVAVHLLSPFLACRVSSRCSRC